MNTDLEQFFRHYSMLTEKPLDFSDVSEPFKVFFPRFDYFLSWCSLVARESVASMVSRYLKGALQDYALRCLENGYLGNFGFTVDPASFTLTFPGAKVTLIWIPKNSCTSIKKMLLTQEPDSLTHDISPTRFHETCQERFGISRAQYSRNMMFPLVAVIRDPYERIVSCYLDKFAIPVMRSTPCEPFVIGHIRAAQRFFGAGDRGVERSISFSEFVTYVTNSPSWALDAHWRPQYCFLGNNVEKIRLFPISRLDEVWDFLGVERRRIAANRSFGGRILVKGEFIGDFANTLPEALIESSLDEYKRFLNPQLRAMINHRYDKDIELYERALVFE